MKKGFAFVRCAIAIFAVMALLGATALAAGDKFEGQWEDTVSQRAWMRIDRNWNGDYDVRVFWGSGVYEMTEWYMTGVLDPTVDQLVYKNGSSYDVYYDDDGDVMESDINYENATGTIWLDSNGYLRFLCSDSSLNGCQFVWSQP